MRRFFARFVNLFRRRGAERDLVREIESHLALLQEDFERRGLRPDEAALAARRAYGGVEQAKELHREARSFVAIEQLAKDIRYGWRNLLRNPGFTLAAALALTLGIGANATIFGIYNAVALKPLPVADASRVVRIKRWNQYWSSNNFAYPEYEYLRDRNNVFSGLTAASQAIPVLASIAGGAPEHLNGYAVSANYFAALGVNARVGRTFLPDEDRAAGANAVVVLSYLFWQRKLHGDPNAAGQTIKLNGLAYTIVGIAPREFTGTDAMPTESGFWAPLSMIEQLDPAFGAGWRVEWRDASHPGFELLARLKDGVARAKAQAEADVLLRGYLSGYRETARTIAVTLNRTAYFGSADEIGFQVFAVAVLLIVSLVLLVACANVANMLLARGVARQREIGIRLALGGGRARVIRQLLAESILLSILGGAGGILLSAWAGRLLWAALTSIVRSLQQVRELDVSPDAHVLVYGLALSVFTGLVFGLVPALQTTRLDLHSAIQQEGAPWAGRLGRARLRGLLLGAQVTVSVLLLVVSGGLMGGLVSSFVKSSELGFETQSTYSVRLYTAKDRLGTLMRLRDRLETLPEVSRVAIGGVPIRDGPFSLPIEVGKWRGHSAVSFASDGYFESLGIRLLRGRSFTRQEAERGATMAVISESMARQVWPGGEALGRRFTFDSQFVDSKEYEVIGVARDIRFVTIAQVDAMHVYIPTGTSKRLLGNLVLRIRGDGGKALAAVASAVESVDPSLAPSLELVSLEAGPVAMQRGLFRVLAAFAGSLSLLALTLAAIGIYGVMAFLVSQRTREIGIRMALGANSREVLRSVVLQGMRPVLIGMLLGLAGATRVFAFMQTSGAAHDLGLFSRTFGDPALYGELALVLAIAVLASAIPAKRALKVDPMVALRHE